MLLLHEIKTELDCKLILLMWLCESLLLRIITYVIY